VLSETNAQIENFDDTINAVSVDDLSERSKRPGCGGAAERAKIVSAVVIKEIWNE
jgi:hypothetical protein